VLCKVLLTFECGDETFYPSSKNYHAVLLFGVIAVFTGISEISQEKFAKIITSTLK